MCIYVRDLENGEERIDRGKSEGGGRVAKRRALVGEGGEGVAKRRPLVGTR